MATRQHGDIRTGRQRRAFAVVLAILASTLTFAFAPVPAWAATVAEAGQYVPVTPGRVLTDVSIPAGGTYAMNLLGRGGIPTAGVSALAFTMTTRSTGSGHLVVYPAGIATPGSSNLNYRPDIPTTNSVTVRVGSGGVISVRNAGTTQPTSIWVDVAGYFTADGVAAAQSTFVPLTPARVMNGVNNDANNSLVVDPAAAGVPATNVSAVVANIIVRSTAVGVATTYPDGAARPVYSAVNYRDDFVYNNQVTVKLGANGLFRVYTTTAAQVYVDVVGYYRTPAGTTPSGNFVGVDPQRLAVVIVEPNSTYTFSPLGRGGVPSTGVMAATLNLTAVSQGSIGSLAVYPSGVARPATNQLTYRVAGTWPTLQVAKLGTDGQISVYNNGVGAVRLLVDVLGYYRPTSVLPGAPTSVTAATGDGQALVRWTAPANTGGSAVTGYRLTADPGGTTLDVVGTARSALFAGLTNGTSYTFTVSAMNVAGQGPASGPSTAVTPRAATAPGAPTGVTAQAGNTAVLVRWQRPADDGRLPIDRYTVTVTPGGGRHEVTAPSTELLVAGLANGTGYTFTVSASNARGTGPASAATPPVTPAVGVPDPPTNVTAVASGTGAITVGWGAPHDDGGSPATGYRIVAAPGGQAQTVPSSVREATFTGLSTGTAYTFTVAATNANGTGVASSPTAPTNPSFALAAQARELSTAALASLTSVGPTALTFANAPAEVRGLTVGTVVIAGEPPAPHQPFLRKVAGVSTNGTVTTVTTTDPTLSEAYASGGFGVQVTSSDGAPAGGATGNAAPMFESTVQRPIGPIDLATGIRAAGTYTSTFTVSWDLGIVPPKARVTMTRSDKVELTVVAEQDGSFDRDIPNFRERRTPEIGGIARTRFKPVIQEEVFFVARGYLRAGTTTNVTLTLDAGTTIDLLAHVPTDLKPPSFRREIQAPTAEASGNLTFGVRAELAFELCGLVVAKVKVAEEVQLDIDIQGDPWWKMKTCYVLGLEVGTALGTVYRNDRLLAPCFDAGDAGGTRFRLEMSPSRTTVRPMGSTSFTARSMYAAGETVIWSVEGGDANGSMTGPVYTAPNRTGVFTVVATVPADGPRPMMRGRATVTVGYPPGPPTVHFAPTAPAGDVPQVLMTFQTNGPAADYLIARIFPDDNPNGPCTGTWQVNDVDDGEEILIDVGELTGERCRQLVPGHAYVFFVRAVNSIGRSAETQSNQVIIVGGTSAARPIVGPSVTGGGGTTVAPSR